MDTIFNFFILGTIPNPICRKHMMEVIKSMKDGKIWALQMLDATSKITVGVMMGNGFEYGNYEECIDVKASGDYRNFTGKHCVVDFPLPIPSEYSSNENLYDIVKFRWSICVPSSCRGTDLTYLIKYGLHQSAVVNERACITKDTNRPLLPWEIFTLCVIGVFLMLVLLSTFYDHFKSSAKKNEFLQSFSITRNFKTMMDMSTPPGSIDALHGIRFSCTVGVILAHVYMCVCIGANVNLIHYTYWLSDWDHLYITSRGVMLDAFFLLGGFLVSYIFMKERNSGKKFNLALYILHRFLRIAPAMYMVLLITATLSNRLSVAPLWRTWSEINERKCHETWWQHVLFIQSWYGNLYCMEHAWYLSVDMQLFIISPIMLYPLHRWPKIGIGVTIFTIVLSFFGSFTSSYLYRENVDLFRNSFKIERDLYELPYNRLGPWAIGIFCGYIAYQNRHYKNNKSEEGNHGCNDSPAKRCKKYLISLILLSISFALGIGVMCAVHPFLQPEYKYNVWESSFYLASSHMMSSLAVLVMICVILAGYGGPFTVLFSAKLFVPLARLSYSIFLIHLTLLKIWYIGTNGPNYLSDYNVMGVWLSIVLYSTLLSPVLFLTIEQPFIEINRVLTKKVYGPSKNFNLEPKDRNHCETPILPMTDLHTGSYNGLPEQLNGRRQQNENTIFNISEAMNVGL